MIFPLACLALLISLIVQDAAALKLKMSVSHNPVSAHNEIRGDVVKALSLLSSGLVLSVAGSRANARVYFDTDTYGDKELKIATVNKIKQKLRNAVNQDPTIAPILFRLAINDALCYDAASGDGGLDASILFELDREENKNLEKALSVIDTVKRELQRTNTVSASDLIAFGGAEALETVGSGRVTVQVGRFDAKKGRPNSQLFNWESPSESAVTSAFTSSGLTAREIVLLLGAYGEINRVVGETQSASAKKSSDEDDEDDDSPDFEKFVPTTFGARDAMYGAKMGKADFGTTYLASLLKKGPSSADPIGKILISNDQTKAFVQKYATNQVAFLQDVPEAYLRMTLLGETYTNRNS
jgi:hypothetical protein